MTKLKPGELVRFAYLDEILVQEPRFCDLYDLSFLDKTEKSDLNEQVEVSLVYKDLQSVKIADENDKIDEIGKYTYVPIATRGMILEVWEGKAEIWYQVLLNKQIVWTHEQNLVKVF